MKNIIGAILIGTGLMTTQATERIVEDFNRGWKFHLGDVPDAAQAGYDDAAWRDVRLPHDWSVELSFTTNHAGGCTAFLPGGIGWYRKTFTIPESSKGKRVRIEFDGVYNNADVWINGHHLGNHPYGYSPFSYELAGHLNFGAENTVVVKADRTAYMDCRWYPGSGIYRNVKLVTCNPVRIPQWGVFVSTKGHTVTVTTDVVNGTAAEKVISLQLDLQDADGKSAGFITSSVSLAAGAVEKIKQVVELAEPVLWNTEKPYLYAAEVTVLDGDNKVDGLTVPFGIRDIRYDPEEGFFLNGENTLLKGVCLHHDGGCVGAAVPDGVWERRLRILKEGGCNAIRTAHNPPSTEFLDLCDRLGFLVQDEAFDEWFNPKDKKYNFNQKIEDERTIGYSKHFGEWAERDVKAMVMRDLNHPSIIMWSIGNEIEWTYPRYSDAAGYWEKKNNVDYYWNEPPYDTAVMKERFSKSNKGEHILAEQAADLSRWIKEVDTSRPVMANVVIPSVSHFSGYVDALDIVGYSYRTVNYDWGHRNYPEKMIVGTENWVQWNEWKAVIEKPFIPGIFLWTGINYLGESLNWPTKANNSGMLDIAGFRKPNYWFFKSFWKETEPMVYIATQPLAESNYLLVDGQIVGNPENRRVRKWGWPAVANHWNYEPEEKIYVELYSNCEETELFLNGKSLGAQRLADHYDDRLLKWVVPFNSGKLMAVGRTGGKEAAFQLLETAGDPVGIKMTVDKSSLEANSCDVAHCVVQLVDAKGVLVKHVEKTVTFTVKGDARNIGVDNGSSKSTQDFQSDECLTANGRCLMVLQGGAAPGAVKVTASAEGLKDAMVVLEQK